MFRMSLRYGVLTFCCLFLVPVGAAGFTPEGKGREVELGAGVFEDVHQTCADFLAFTQSQWGAKSAVYDEANRLFPDSALARALHIGSHLPYQYARKAIPVEVRAGMNKIKHVRGRPRFSVFSVPAKIEARVDRQIYSDIRVMPDPDLNSLRYMSLADVRWLDGLDNFGVEGKEFRTLQFVPHSTAKAVVDWGAGLTGLISHSGRVFKQLSVMNSRNPQSFVRRFIRENNSGMDWWVDTAAVTIDKPFHGSGSFSAELRSLENTLMWREQYFRKLQEAKLPVVAACRSGESIPLAALNHQHPGLFAGMIWMAPMHPVVGYQSAIEGYIQTNRETMAARSAGAVEAEPVILSQSFDWFTHMRDELVKKPNPWWESEQPVGSTPLLILVGGNDPEVPETTRAYFRDLSRRFPSLVFYVEVPGASHDVFAVTEDTYGNSRGFTTEANERAAKVWSYVYWFIQTKVLKQQDGPPPPFGFLLQ